MSTTSTEFHHVPHFDVTSLAGRRVRYEELWQRRNLVLVLADPREREAALSYASKLEVRADEFDKAETTVVVTTDSVRGLPARGAIVADRWGEILYMEAPAGGNTPQFPSVDELLSWVEFARIQCPECPP